MELFREEYKLKQPPNYGLQLYNRLKEREKEVEEGSSRPLAPPPAVASALIANPVITGPLNCETILSTLTEDELCEFFSNFPRCNNLVFTKWKLVTPKVLRCISLVMGERLLEVDFSYSQVKNTHLEIILSKSTKVKVLKFNYCPNIDGPCMSTLARLFADSLIEIYLIGCPLLKIEPLQWMAGCIGFMPPKLHKLQVLDLSETPIVDDGLSAVATSIKKLRFLNLKDCIELTDTSMIKILEANPKLQLLNVSCCTKLTNKTANTIGKNCHEMLSLNLSKCLLITDVGVKSICLGCPKLQALNIAGLLKVTEMALFVLAENCKGIQMLNVTGCQTVTVTGINALIQGLGYIEPAISFMGFKPVDKHVEKKLDGQLAMIEYTALKKIQDEMDAIKKAQEEADEARHNLLNGSAHRIQLNFRAYMCRMVYWRIWRNRMKHSGALFFQRVWRGFQGRRRFARKWKERAEFLAKAVYAFSIQRIVRGHLARKHNPRVSGNIRLLYKQRLLEAQTGIAVRMQSCSRRYLARRRMKAWKEIVGRRWLDEQNAIISMQMLARRYNAIAKVNKMRYERNRLIDLQRRCATKIQKWYIRTMDAWFLKLDGNAMMNIKRGKWKSTMLVQRLYRGWRGREKVRKKLIQRAFMHKAAIMIQKSFRGARVLHWKDMRLNIIAAYVFDRHYLERRDAMTRSRYKYQQFLLDNQKDSASEPDQEEELDIDWQERFDKVKKRPYWYDPNEKKVTYDRPKKLLAHEKEVIGFRVKVYWPLQREWYEGTISKYHIRKQRHRIDYDDGDHEYMNLKGEYDRVQIQSYDGSWMLYSMFESSAMSAEDARIKEKRDMEDFKRTAYEDACQWVLVQNDRTGDIMYMSNKTGEMRMGASECANWVVQDDGYGFPSFYNIETQDIVFEDPRFFHDVHRDLAAQRSYCMQELRLALYFCDEYWKTYSKAMEVNDKHKANTILAKVRNSPKPKQLTSFLVRAKALYKEFSIVDQPKHQNEIKEMEYAAWIALRMEDMMKRAEEVHREKEAVALEQSKLMTTYVKEVLHCSSCGRQTKRNLDFCLNCGKRQIFMTGNKIKPIAEEKEEQEPSDKKGGGGSGGRRGGKSEAKMVLK